MHIEEATLIASLLIGSTGCLQTIDARVGSPTLRGPSVSALDKTWNHGAEDCASNTDPAIEVRRVDESSYVLRQNKCLSFEAPFIYVLIGERKVLVVDTGATESASEFPLYQTVTALLRKHSTDSKRALLVVHSHSHLDHRAGDAQFEGNANVALVKPNGEAVRKFFDLDQWPEGEAQVELGGRRLTVIPTPGHHKDAIAIYDPQTKWLLTGDTLYPGYIYVRDWEAYRASIARLALFVETNEVSAVLGAHIEMTTESGKYYPIGTVYQPNEARLALPAKALGVLDSKLETLDEPTILVFDAFIVAPMSGLQKTISGAAGWFVD